MKVLSLILSFLLIQNIIAVTFLEAMLNLGVLENYIRDYKLTHTTSYSVKQLTLCYIREGKYHSSIWDIAAGSCPTDLEQYINERDANSITNTSLVRTYGEIETPSGDTIDFVHLFATMNGIDFGNSYTEGYSSLVGWGGDCAKLAQDLMEESGTLEDLVTSASTNYLGIKGQFGSAILTSDLDAPSILMKKNDLNTFATVMTLYYTKLKGDYKNRVKNFLDITFPGVSKNDLRDELYKRYSDDSNIKVLECNYELRNSFIGCAIPGSYHIKYKNHAKAATYAFADYLTSNS